MTRHKNSSILFWLVARNFALPFFCAVLIFVSVFLLNDCYNDVTDFMKEHVSLHKTIAYFLLLQPKNLVHIIPISVLLAASFMTLMMGRNNELTAMRAAGISLGSGMLPVWIMAGLATIATFAINENWGVTCTRQALRIQDESTKKDDDQKLIYFHHPEVLRDWNMSRFSLERKMGENLMLVQVNQEGHSAWRLSAQKAQYRDKKWIFENGVYCRGSQVFFFQKYVMTLPETPEMLVSHTRDWSVANIGELRAIRNGGVITSKKGLDMLQTLIWDRFTFPLVCFVGALLGVACTVATDRMGLMKGFAVAILGFVFYYFVTQGCLTLGKNGWLTPFLGGAFPKLALLGVAIRLMWKKQ